MVESENEYVHNTNTGSGIRHKYIINSINNSVTIPEESDIIGNAYITPTVNPIYAVPDISSSVSNYFGIERIYNITEGKDVTKDIIKVTDRTVYVDPTHLSNNDVVRVTVYTNALSWANSERISSKWVEQMYRHSTNLDRTDFGSHTPSFDWSVDNSDYDAIGWSFHQRLFYSFGGWYHEDDRNNTAAGTCGPISHTDKTILSWYPNSSTSVGIFAGDPALNEIRSLNEKFIVQPIPFYITGMTFFCKMDNALYEPEKGAAVQLNVNINGKPNAMTTAPYYELSTGEREIRSKFGNDKSLMLSFATNLDYGGLTPSYAYGREINSNNYKITHKRISCQARSLDVSAKVVGEDADWDEIDEWYLTFSGALMYGYDKA